MREGGRHALHPTATPPLRDPQEVLSRHELVALLADVFGPANMRLLDELRAVLNARGTLEMTVSEEEGRKGEGIRVGD